MSVIEIRKNPSRRELAWFGLLLALFFGVIGGLVTWHAGGPTVLARVLWFVGVGLAIVYYAIPPVRRPIYLGWIYGTYPIGWVISHVILALVYYGVVTPVGLVMRAAGHDPMQRRLDPNAATYWVEREEAPELPQYFKQF